MPADLEIRLERLLAERFRDGEPGAVLGVYRDGELASSAAVGLARLDPVQPITTSTVMDIASVSKQMTAATVLLLARDGLVDVDGEVREFLQVVPAGITLRHCLQHTSGLPDYLSFAEIVGGSVEQACAREHFLAALPELCRSPAFAAGATIRYSNTGYVLAALVAEQVTGSRWDALVAERVFDPLGMRSTHVAIAVEPPAAGNAVGYTRGADGSFAVDQLGEDGLALGTLQVIGDGEVRTTVEDLAAWHGFLADGRVLGADVRNQLMEPARLRDGRETSYGMGLWWHRLGGIRTYGHSGSMWGFRAYSITDAASRLGVCVLSNDSGTPAGELAWRALREGLDERGTSGTWVALDPGQVIEASVTADGGLLVTDDGEQRLTRTSDDTWVSAGVHGQVTRRGAELAIRDNLGAEILYQRLDPTDRVLLNPVVGRYRCEHPAVDLELTAVEGQQHLRIGSGPEEPLVYLGRVAATRVHTVGARVVLVDAAPGGQVVVFDGSVQLRFERAPE